MVSAGPIYRVAASWVAACTSISSRQQWEDFLQEEPRGPTCSLQGPPVAAVCAGWEGGVVRETGASGP